MLDDFLIKQEKIVMKKFLIWLSNHFEDKNTIDDEMVEENEAQTPRREVKKTRENNEQEGNSPESTGLADRFYQTAKQLRVQQQDEVKSMEQRNSILIDFIEKKTDFPIKEFVQPTQAGAKSNNNSKIAHNKNGKDKRI